ncbi:hypothetical protein E2C01_049060 [Portunus trituberculatus]|uniref:Uncharacterized protein n=1 Tax=Portunus trituberculatus TaxID=210409 RepID=A0A5B7GBV6_PORTR|nr:hypothetical protein [Portunus trituberculatus]
MEVHCRRTVTATRMRDEEPPVPLWPVTLFRSLASVLLGCVVLFITVVTRYDVGATSSLSCQSIIQSTCVSAL